MILITGAAGFIGSNLVASLARRETRGLIVCDWLGNEEKWRNIGKYEISDFVHPENLLDYLDQNSDKISIVYHLGAISSTTETNADLIIQNNFCLSRDLWDWCAKNGVSFIYASSAATYGNGENNFDDLNSCEALGQLQPLNAYGWSKHLFDRMIMRRVKEGMITPPQWVGLKFFNVYGPNEYHKGNQKSVVPQIFEQIKQNGVAKLFESHNKDYSNGEQLRDFVWVDDCTDMMIWLSNNQNVSGIFNCGTGKARSFNDLAKSVFSALGIEPSIEYIPTPLSLRGSYQYFTQANMQRINEAGYKFKTTSLELGIKKYVQDYLCQSDPYR